MARSKLTETKDDLIEDSGSVLWSFVKGEQLEFPITLTFVKDVTAGYTYEAVVVEADNVPEDATVPTNIRSGGVQTKLTVRIPVDRGTWDSGQAYNKEEVVLYNGQYYKLAYGVARLSSVSPDLDSTWEKTNLNRVYLQFPKTLGATWSVQPTVGYPVYGFFELRVTAPADSIFQRTWKPIRGMVQILFSPTEIVPD
jgi:hypothetical protein